MVDELQLLPIAPVADPARGRSTDPGGGPARQDATGSSAREAGVEVRTLFAPGSRRIFTDILDPATREVLYRIPPQSVTDAVVRLSDATSRYERLLSGVAWYGRKPEHSL